MNFESLPGGQFASAEGGQFGSAKGGHIKSAGGGQVDRRLQYDGVSPRRYLDFFKMDGHKRKEKGEKINFSAKEVRPKNTLSLRAIPILEMEVTNDLKKKKIIIA